MNQGVDFMVEPCEAITFGPPRSASAGEAHRIVSMFPPSPMSFQGMVRTRLLYGAEPALDLDSGRDKAAIEQLVGTPQALPDGWQLRGPFPARRLLPAEPGERDVVQPWLPAPRFLLRAGSAVVQAREVVSPHPGLSDLQDAPPLLGRPELGKAKPLGGWIGPAALRAALAGEDFDGGFQQWAAERPPFVPREFQPGLAVDYDTASARHGMLYFNDALRFVRGAGLYGRLDAPLDPRLQAEALTAGAVQAGRKGRLAACRPVERLDADWAEVMAGRHLPAEVDENERFWLLAITPVWLENPRLPMLHATLPGSVQVHVRAALTGQVEAIGGYQLADGRPRPNRLFVPAGSAWLIELSGGNSESRREALSYLHNTHPLGPREEAAMGFGHTLVGRGPGNKKETR